MVGTTPAVSGIEVEILEQSVDRADLKAAAELHCSELPESAISRLGPSGASSFYGFAVSSTFEQVFVVRIEGKIVACAVLSHAPQSLSRRFALHALRDPRLAAALLRYGLRSALRISSRRHGAPPVAEAPNHRFPASYLIPELSLIFTDRTTRGKGLGTKLLVEIEATLRKTGIRNYFARTNAGRENPAIVFYDRSGFKRLGYSTGKKPLLVMTKSVSGP